MNVALTGGTGFVGRYILRELLSQGHSVRCWFRPESDRTGLEDLQDNKKLTWVRGSLEDVDSATRLLGDCDAVVHSALYHPSGQFRGGEENFLQFANINVMGTLRLFEMAHVSDMKRFVFISTCAVHETILDDRPLDETHPLWPANHYGAHKAALEKFVHSYAAVGKLPICSLRPTGVYGLRHPAPTSKWYRLIKSVVDGRDVTCERGGKEVHAHDVARAACLLLDAPAESIMGQSFNCYDQYISEYMVAHLAKKISRSDSNIVGEPKSPKHQIETGKIRGLGMEFGGDDLLEETICQIINQIESK